MIVPSIDIMNGRAVQLRQGREFVLDGGDPIERLEEFSIVGEVAVIDLDAALGKGTNKDLIRRMCRMRDVRVGGGIRSVEAALSWLDAGARKVIIGTAATEEFCAQLPRERTIAAVDAVGGEVVVEGWRTRTGDPVTERIRRLAPHVGGFLLTQVEWEGRLEGFDTSLVEEAIAHAEGARITAAGGIRSEDDVAALDALGADAQVGMALYTGRLTLGRSIARLLVRPPVDGLWPTVVVDDSGAVLGLVWSSAASIDAAVESRKGIYWSRSRSTLWEKGLTSGNTQALLRVDVDCDRDALKFTVRQTGGFCHTGSRTCWGDVFDLSRLEETLRERATGADPGSGTARVLSSPALLEAKLIEEARELAAAESDADVVHEAADVVYFLMAAIARSGAHIPDVLRELERRAHRVRRRPMTSKHRPSDATGGAAASDSKTPDHADE